MAVQRIEAPQFGGMWLITGYDEGRAALIDPRLSRDARHAPDRLRELIEQSQRDSAVGRNMLDSDPPEHTRLRAAVKRAFTPRRVERLRPRVEEITAGLVSALEPGSEVDLVDALAFPLPVTVICELLGLPVEDRAQFRAWSGRLVQREREPEQAAVAGKAMRDYLEDFVAGLRVVDGSAEDQPDLTRALLVSQDLDHTELVSMLILLLIAGHETTVNLISGGMAALFADPDQLALVRDDPSLAPRAIEELLRYAGPLQSALPRVALEDMEVSGTTIPAGSVVGVTLAAANRDPARFADPERMDVTRTDNPHLSFGHGTHFCLGASLARVEAQVAITALLTRFPGIRQAVPSVELEWREGIIRGLVALPVVLDQ
jgi:cytochrome P450